MIARQPPEAQQMIVYLLGRVAACERRSAVIWRKLSFGTQSESGSRFVETLLTILETCRRQNKNPIDDITHALTTGQPEPLKVGV